jgi:hypothetical protein
MLPLEPTTEQSWEALRRRARQARFQSARIRQAHREIVQAGEARRERDRAVERALAWVAQEGDQRARDALVRRYRPIVCALARDANADADRVDAGLGELLRAVDTWDPGTGAPFREYVLARVRAVM